MHQITHHQGLVRAEAVEVVVVGHALVEVPEGAPPRPQQLQDHLRQLLSLQGPRGRRWGTGGEGSLARWSAGVLWDIWTQTNWVWLAMVSAMPVLRCITLISRNLILFNLVYCSNGDVDLSSDVITN